MTVTFGDAEPEDAWHPDDPVPVLLDNLARRLDIRVRAATGDDRRRLELIADDIRFLRDRIAADG